GRPSMPGGCRRVLWTAGVSSLLSGCGPSEENRKPTQQPHSWRLPPRHLIPSPKALSLHLCVCVCVCVCVCACAELVAVGRIYSRDKIGSRLRRGANGARTC